jgi:hypothetical protein
VFPPVVYEYSSETEIEILDLNSKIHLFLSYIMTHFLLNRSYTVWNGRITVNDELGRPSIFLEVLNHEKPQSE